MQLASASRRVCGPWSISAVVVPRWPRGSCRGATWPRLGGPRRCGGVLVEELAAAIRFSAPRVPRFRVAAAAAQARQARGDCSVSLYLHFNLQIGKGRTQPV